MKHRYDVLQFAPSRLLTALATGVAVAAPFAHAQQVSPPPSKAAQAETGKDTVLAPVIVKAKPEGAERKTYQPGVTNIGKMPVLPRDVPQTLTILNHELLLDRGVDSMKDALRSVAGITFNAAEGGTNPGDNINIRGFSARGDFYRDGIRDTGQYNRDVFDDERIEVLKGSASMLFGRGSTGAVINQVSKKAYLLDEGNVALGLGLDQYVRATADVNQIVGQDAALRINAMVQDSDNYRKGLTSKRTGFAADWRFGIGTGNEFDLSYSHLNYNDKPDQGFRWYDSKPVEQSADYFYGVDSDYQRDSADTLSGSWTHRFDKDTNLKTVLRFGEYKRDFWATTAGFPTGGAANPANNPSNPSSTVNRGSISRGGHDKNIFNQTDLTAKRKIAGLDHLITAGLDVAHEESDVWGYAGTTTKPATTLGNPNTANIATGTRTRVPGNSFSDDALGVYAQDMAELTKEWKILLGVRWDYFDAEYFRPTNSPQLLKRTDRLRSYRGGIIYQPNDMSSYYVSVGNSFNTSGDLYQFDALTASTPPEESRNYELGAKWDLFNSDLSLNAALFRTEKFNERNTDPDTVNATNYVLSGKRHTDGIELSAAGRVTPKWDVFFNYQLVHATVDKSNLAGRQDKRPGNTPIYSGNIWTTYKVAQDWKVGGGIQRISERNPPENGTQAISANLAPAYTRYDGLIQYEVTSYKVQVNLINLTDKIFFDTLYNGFAVPGPRRTVQVTTTYKF